MSPIEPAAVLLSLAAGGILGAIYLLLLHRTVRLVAAGASLAGPAGLTLLRLAGAAAVFWILARQGAVPLLAGLLGFLAARLIARRLAMPRP